MGKFINELDSSFAKVEMSEGMRRRLQRSDYIFSGLKTFHELNEAFPSLIDSNGNRKPFETFLNDVRKIDRTYNRNYLRAEYAFAVASAEMATKWERFAEDGDEYNLQYRTAADDRVRPEHAPLHGVTLPMPDPFWQEYYPPNDWGCRCDAVQVRKSKYPVTDHDKAMELGAQALQRDKKGMFHFNPGIEGKTFPDYNPYAISRCRDCDIAQGRGRFAKGVPNNELCAACQYIRACEGNQSETITIGTGTIEVSNLVDRNDSDFPRLYQVAHHFAMQGERVLMTRSPQFDYDCIYGSLKGTPYYGKCPDLKVGNFWYEHEGFVTDNPKRAFSNMINHGLKQSDRIIIDRPELTEYYMTRSIRNRIRKGAAITEVWIRNSDGSLNLLFKKDDRGQP